jgi:glycosyltransferase involved in cell wall biosynthesis/2-polyprenyl-3-methyl-5-hydroxy-6-metoxy-1,4-benzoquinol methylase
MVYSFFVYELGNGGQERQLFYIIDNLQKDASNEVNLFVWVYDENQKYAKLIQPLRVNVIRLNEEQYTLKKILRVRKELSLRRSTILQSFSFPLNFFTMMATIFTPVKPVGALRSSFLHLKSTKKGLKGFSVFINSFFPKVIVSNNLRGRTELLNFRSNFLRKGQIYYLGNKLTLPTGIEPKSIVKPRKLRFVSMGSLISIKRWDFLIQILSELKASGLEFEHFMAGANGPLRDELKALIKRNNLEPYVFMSGEVSNLKDFYDEASLLFHTSSSEGTPNVVLEALSHGVPVISSDCGDVRLFVKEFQTGFVIGTDSIAEWVEKINMVVTDDILYSKLSLGAINISKEILSDKILASEFDTLQKNIMKQTDSESLVKSTVVQSKFNQTQLYLDKNSSIGARIFLVNEILGKTKFDSALDLGCGDGSIGLSLLDRLNKLKLIDISPNMIEKAKGNTPSELIDNKVSYLVYDGTKFRNDQPFDLIICLGVIAHVDSMNGLFDALSENLKPGGLLLFQFTEKSSIHGWVLYKFFGKGFGAYDVNKTTARVIIPELKKRGCVPINDKIYSEATFGLSRFGTNVGVRFKILTSRMKFLKFFFSERLVLFQKEF